MTEKRHNMVYSLRQDILYSFSRYSCRDCVNCESKIQAVVENSVVVFHNGVSLHSLAPYLQSMLVFVHCPGSTRGHTYADIEPEPVDRSVVVRPADEPEL